MKTIEIKIPDEIATEDVINWIKIFVDRFYNSKLLPPNYTEVEVSKQAFITANKMEIKPVEEIKEEVIETKSK